MRFLIFAVFGVLISAQSLPRRKSLNFRSVLPHARFVSNADGREEHARLLHMDSSNLDPFDVAKKFIEKKMEENGAAGSFEIREDSYTDESTGVSHIYVQQKVEGLPVNDGLFNLNVKNGVVLSFGDSFYRGPAKIESPSGDPHSEHCATLRKHSPELLSGPDAETLSLRQNWNCDHIDSPQIIHGKLEEKNLSDPRAALLQFIIAATPNQKLAPKLLSEPKKPISEMTLTKDGDGFLIGNAPEALKPVSAKEELAQIPSDDDVHLVRVWKFEVQMENNWYEAAVTVDSPHRIVSVADWIADAPLNFPEIQKTAFYEVFEFGIKDPESGNRTIRSELNDRLASPWGWHTTLYSTDPVFEGDGRHLTTTTWGNNVLAQENWANKTNLLKSSRPDAGDAMIFNFPYSPHPEASPVERKAEPHRYVNASVTQMFYVANMYHDLMYRYGFDEVAGNFQQYNFAKGGREYDAVVATAQDAEGYNNANFATPPDGRNGRMRMYLFNRTNPFRDANFEQQIIVHELSHGLSTRLTGGPAHAHCLSAGEAQALGEGWGDFLGTMVLMNDHDLAYRSGGWVIGNPGGGIRPYPYSVDKQKNPDMYSSLNDIPLSNEHRGGAVWAEMLFVVAVRLIDQHGFSKTLFPPKPLLNGTIPDGDFYRPQQDNGMQKPRIPKHGNTLAVKLVVTAMKMQPCHVTFMAARDAIIGADNVLTGGENYCTLWAAFAERGLGWDAIYTVSFGFKNGHVVPLACLGN